MLFALVLLMSDVISIRKITTYHSLAVPDDEACKAKRKCALRVGLLKHIPRGVLSAATWCLGQGRDIMQLDSEGEGLE